VCVIASGPSLTQADCDALAATDWKFIVVNDSWRRAPFADVLWGCDGAWWDVHYQTVKKEFKGERWTQDLKAAERYDISRIGSVNKPGLGRHGILHQGGNGGYQAINLAWHWGAAKIFLLGLDCKPAQDGKAHWFGQHEHGLSKIQNYKFWNDSFPKLAADLRQEGLEVINLTRDTALMCFTRMPLEKALALYGTSPC
jgi:hypothetical protein